MSSGSHSWQISGIKRRQECLLITSCRGREGGGCTLVPPYVIRHNKNVLSCLTGASIKQCNQRLYTMRLFSSLSLESFLPQILCKCLINFYFLSQWWVVFQFLKNALTNPNKAFWFNPDPDINHIDTCFFFIRKKYAGKS